MRVSERWQQGPESQWGDALGSANRRQGGVMQATHGGKASSGGVALQWQCIVAGTWRIKSDDLGDEEQLASRDTTLWTEAEKKLRCVCCLGLCCALVMLDRPAAASEERRERSCKEFFTGLGCAASNVTIHLTTLIEPKHKLRFSENMFLFFGRDSIQSKSWPLHYFRIHSWIVTSCNSNEDW